MFTNCRDTDQLIALVVQEIAGQHSVLHRRNTAPEGIIKAGPKPCQILSGESFNAPPIHRPVGFRIKLGRIDTRGLMPGRRVRQAVIEQYTIAVKRYHWLFFMGSSCLSHLFSRLRSLGH